MEACIDAMEAMVGDDATSVGVGSNCPQHRLASMEEAEHAVGHGGGDVAGPEGHVVDDA